MNHIVEHENRYQNDLGRENRSAIRCSIAMALLAVAAVAAGALVALAQKPPSSDMLAYTSAAAPEPTESVGNASLPRHIVLPARGPRSPVAGE
jgi:hypothetical protein